MDENHGSLASLSGFKSWLQQLIDACVSLSKLNLSVPPFLKNLEIRSYHIKLSGGLHMLIFVAGLDNRAWHVICTNNILVK